MMKKFFLLFSTLVVVSLASGLQAESLFDESRVQSIVERQTSTLVRVKSVIELPAEAQAEQTDKADKPDKAADAKPSEKKEAQKNEPKTLLRLGTGFFVSSDGQILTNASVVDGAKRLWYEVDGVSYLAELRGMDVATNTALLQAKTMPKSFTTVNLADNVSLPGVGAFLVRLSLPLEFSATPTTGILQGTDTQFGSRAFPTRYLRVQLMTGPGEGGSPVFDLQGRFVGMTVAVLPELGATYVLPARALSWMRDSLAAGAHTSGYFGFNVNEEHSAETGSRLVVRNVDEKGPAAVAGLQLGDVVTEASRRAVNSISDLRDAVFYVKVGQYLDLKVRRGDKETPIAIQAQEKKRTFMSSIKIDYQGQLHCRVTHEKSGVFFHTDAPTDHDGKGESFAPTDVIATSYGSCVVTAMAIDAEKKGISLAGTTATVVKEIAPKPPRRIGRLIVDVRLPARLTPEERKFVEHIAHTCPVKYSLHPEIDLQLKFHYA